jgi:putative addiction module killer protein
MSGYQQFQIRHYLTPDGRDLYEEWRETLDRPVADRIDAYVTRMASGNFGVSRSIGGGIQELKIDFGPGYRVYYLRDEGQLVVLLCGGDKQDQPADISMAKRLGVDYWRRK